MSPHGMTRNEAHALRAVVVLTGPDGVAPSIRQIAKRLGRAPSQVHGILGRLQDKGWLKRGPGARNLVLLQDPPPAVLALPEGAPAHG